MDFSKKDVIECVNQENVEKNIGSKERESADSTFSQIIEGDNSIAVNSVETSEEKNFVYKMVSNTVNFNSGSDFYKLESSNKQLGYSNGNASDTATKNTFGETYLYVGLKNVTQLSKTKIVKAKFFLPIVSEPMVMNSNGFFSAYGVTDSGWINSNINWSNKPNSVGYAINAVPRRNRNENGEYVGSYYLEFDVTSILNSGCSGFVIKGNHSGDRFNGGWKNSVFVPAEGNHDNIRLDINSLEPDQVSGEKSIAQSCNRAGNGSIDLFSGNLTFEHQDVSFDGVELPINISHVYNSYNYDKDPDEKYKCGYGWHLSFLQTLRRISQSIDTSAGDNESYAYINAAGKMQKLTTRYYKNYTVPGGSGKQYKLYCNYDAAQLNNGQQFKEISNESFVLEKEQKGVTVYNVLKDESGNKLWFDISEGRLCFVTAPNSLHELQIDYVSTGNIQVKDNYSGEVKRVVDFEFADSKLTAIKYNGQTICSFDYGNQSETDRLKRITYGASGTNNYSEYEYDSVRGCLYKITDPAGYIVEYKQSFNILPVMTGYYIKSKTGSISYNSDENQGVKYESAETIAEEATITYNNKLPDIDTVYWECDVDNLTIVTNSLGVKEYYSFRSDGTLQLYFDDRNNMMAKVIHGVSVDTDDGYKVTTTQASAEVLETAPSVDGQVMDIEDYFEPNQHSTVQTFTYGTYTNLGRGTYLLMASLNGVVTSGDNNFDDLAEARQKNIPYTAIKVDIETGPSIIENFSLFDSAVSGEYKRQIAVLPFVVEGASGVTVKVAAESFGNPNSAMVDTWTLFKAANYTETKIYDKDRTVTRSCGFGEKVVNTVNDITGEPVQGSIAGISGCKCKKSNVMRGLDVITSKTYYDPANRILKQENGLGLTSEYSYGVNNDKSYITFEKKSYANNSMCSSYAYDNSSSLIDNVQTSATDEAGNTVRYEYNDYAMLRKVIMPGTEQAFEYEYNGVEGLLNKIKAVSNSSWHVEETSNNMRYNKGYLTRVEHDGCKYDFSYDGFGRIVSVSVAGKKIVECAYFKGNNLDGVIGAVKKDVTLYLFGKALTNALSDVMANDASFYNNLSAADSEAYASYYDKYNRLIKTRRAYTANVNNVFSSSDDYITVTRPSQGRVIYTLGSSKYEYNYDRITGELLDTTEYENNVPKIKCEYTFDLDNDDAAIGRVTGVSFTIDNNYTLSYNYLYKRDCNDELSSIVLPSGKTSSVETDGFGRIISRTVNTSAELKNIYTYKLNGTYTTPLVQKEELKVGNNSSVYQYAYDSNNNILTIKNASGSLIVSYEYDGLNRLIRENIVGGNTTVFKYDKSGNIQFKKIYSYSAASGKTVNELINGTTGNTISYGYGISTNKDKLTSYNGSGTLTYNNYGNPEKWFKHSANSSSLGYTLQWEHVTELASITDANSGATYTYKYNDQGIRTEKVVNGVTHKYYLQDEQIIAEKIGNNLIKFYYDATGVCGFNYNGTDYYYQKNIQGDILKVFNGNGTLYAEYSYDAWGKCTIKSNVSNIAAINPFRYRGYYLDDETGLYYLNARYYDPEIGRFISPDSIDYLDPESINGLNIYVYCGNNPVMNVDPSGTEWWNPLSWFDNLSNIGKIIIGVVAFIGAVALTVATGGALAPMFITLGIGLVSGTLIGGFGAVISSGGDWSQFGKGAFDGFSDGMLWGGIFALAGATFGAIKYAVKGRQGAIAGTTKMTTIKKGQTFDRFGSEYGKFITDVGTPASKLALPATNSGVKLTLQATKNFRVFTGIVADGFGGTGGGVQYVLRYSIKTLLEKGWLIIV